MAYTAEDLLDFIKSEFETSRKNSAPVYKVLEKIRKEAASYEDVAEYADEIGRICSDAFRKFCTGEYLGAVELSQAVADGTIPPMLRESYSLVSDVTTRVQTLLNNEAGLGIKAQTAEFNAEAAQNLANKAVNVSRAEGLERAQWVLDEPVKTFTRQVVDDTLKANVEFQAKAGLRPVIRRKMVGGCCEWCAALAGQWDYGEEPKDIYRRHERCRCVIHYFPGDGRRQNAYTKAWTEAPDDLDMRKTVGLITEPKMLSASVEDVTGAYVRSAWPNVGTVTVEAGVDRALKKSEIRTAEWLKANFGGDIRVLRELNGDKVKTPDFIWDGKPWELKAVSSITSIDRQIRKAAKQVGEASGGVVVDISGRTASRAAVSDEIVTRLSKRAKGSLDVIVMENSELVKVLRYEK